MVSRVTELHAKAEGLELRLGDEAGDRLTLWFWDDGQVSVRTEMKYKDEGRAVVLDQGQLRAIIETAGESVKRRSSRAR